MTPGMPCKLCTPHVSPRPIVRSSSGVTNAKPSTEMAPAATPTSSAPEQQLSAAWAEHIEQPDAACYPMLVHHNLKAHASAIAPIAFAEQPALAVGN